MNAITTTTSTGTITVASSSNFIDYLLAELKCAALRSRLLTAEIGSISAALRGAFITTDDAIAWLDEAGGLDLTTIVLASRARAKR